MTMKMKQREKLYRICKLLGFFCDSARKMCDAFTVIYNKRFDDIIDENSNNDNNNNSNNNNVYLNRIAIVYLIDFFELIE